MNTKKNLFYLIVLILCFGFVVQAQETQKLQIAVMDLNNTGGLSQQESITLTNRLRSMLVHTEAFIVLERGKMEGILQEQGFQQTGCTSTDCAVEMGRLLNVQKIISGSTGKVGKVITIDIVLIDIKTARIDKSFMFDHKGEIGGLLDLIKTIADEIANSVKPAAEKVKQFGSLEIKTKPGRASVYLDENLIGNSPILLPEVAIGSHHLRIKANGYDSAEKTVFINQKQKTSVDIRLKKLYSLSVTSTPAGATVFINNKEAGTTPFTTTVKEGMKFEVRLVKENYREWKKGIKVKDDIEINQKLKFSDKYKKELSRKAKGEKETSVVQKETGGGSKWLWIGGGAVVAGGAAYFILSKDDEEKSTNGDEGILPRPAGRPQ